MRVVEYVWMFVCMDVWGQRHGKTQTNNTQKRGVLERGSKTIVKTERRGAGELFSICGCLYVWMFGAQAIVQTECFGPWIHPYIQTFFKNYYNQHSHNFEKWFDKTL